MKDWRIRKLGDVCKFQGGSQPPKSTFSTICKEDHIRLIQMRDYKTNKYIVFIPKNKARRFCTKDDVMIGRYGPPVFQILRGLEGAYNVALMKAVPDESQLSKDFLFYFLKSPKVQQYVINLSARAAGQSGLNKRTIEPYLIPLPPISEQQQIVEILDNTFEGIDRAIANTEKNLANTRELFESYLNAIFTQKGDDWVEKKLGDVCNFLNGFAFKSTDVVKQSAVQLVRMGNLYKNKLDLTRKPIFYPDEFQYLYKKYILEEGDLIMSLTGTVDKKDYGYTVQVPKIKKILLLNQRIAKFINIDFNYVYEDFFLYLLRSKLFLSDLYCTSRGVRQANLSSSLMKQLKIHLPPVKSQKLFVLKVRKLESEIQRLKAIYQRKLEALQELKQSILHKAFTGELTNPIVKEDAA